jgi:hypothetical protein
MALAGEFERGKSSRSTAVLGAQLQDHTPRFLKTLTVGLKILWRCLNHHWFFTIRSRSEASRFPRLGSPVSDLMRQVYELFSMDDDLTLPVSSQSLHKINEQHCRAVESSNDIATAH